MKATQQILAIAALCFAAAGASAQQGPLSYGAPITVDAAKKAAAGALAEARKNGWFMALAITDPAGGLVYFEKMDNTQHGSPNIAVGKARSAALFRRPTKVFNDLVNKGNTYLLGLEGAVPVNGGLPIVVDGRIIGGIGLSGGTGDQDAQCAQAGLDALK